MNWLAVAPGLLGEHLGDVVVFVVGVFFAICALYLLVLSVAALFYKQGQPPVAPAAPASPSRRLAVLVPAHNEADYIARCVRSLEAQSYPRRLYETVVVADNCDDDTAHLAMAAGARVMVRRNPGLRGKGYALRWAMERLLEAEEAPDAIVIVDADTVADREFLERLTRPLEEGAEAVQGESLISERGSWRAALQAAAFLLVNRTRPSGQAVLHLPCNLAGNGMLLTSQLLRAQPWSAFTSAEDLEYTIELRLRGVRPVFARGALLYSPGVNGRRAADQQRLRWVGGKLHVARRQIPALVARSLATRRPELLEPALHLAVPPLALLVSGIGLGTIICLPLVATGLLAPWAWAPWLMAAVLVPAEVLVGLKAADAPRWAYRAMARAPLFVCAKCVTAYRLLGFQSNTWVRGHRPGDPVGQAADS